MRKMSGLDITDISVSKIGFESIGSHKQVERSAIFSELNLRRFNSQYTRSLLIDGFPILIWVMLSIIMTGDLFQSKNSIR